MPKVYKDDAGLMKSMKEILSKKEQYKIKIIRKYNKK
jgi:DUF2075 family protein